MTRLRLLLDELQEALAGIGVDLGTGAAPGASAEEIAEAGRVAGVALGDEIREWFEWHNGARPGTHMVDRSVSPGGLLITLDQAIEDHRNWCRIAEGDPEFFPGDQLFPVLIHAGGGMLAVYGDDTRWSGCVDVIFPDSGRHDPPLFTSLGAMVEILLSAIHDGVISVKRSAHGARELSAPTPPPDKYWFARHLL